MIRNLAGQSIGAQMVNAATGAAFVGTVTVYLTIDAGIQTIGSVGSGICTAEGNGYFTYLPSQAETDGALVAFTFIGTGAIPQTIQVATVTAAQQSALQQATGTLAVVTTTILADALRELLVLQPSQPPSGEDAVFALGKLNRLLDNWNADRDAVYADLFSTFTLTPGLQPHTIGPQSATWNATQRPLEIQGAMLIYTNVTPNVYAPIRVRDKQWWQSLRVPTWASATPTDCYFEAGWPNGSIYFWPVPSTAFQVQLLTRLVLGQLALTDTVWYPPGYRDAITLTLAEDLAAPFAKPLPATLPVKAAQARARIFGQNVEVPRIRTAIAGMPGSGRGSTFDFRTGRVG